MSQETGSVTPIPPHLRTVTPRLVVHDGVGALEFYVRAFGAEAIGDLFEGPDGQVIHAEMKIGDSVVMVTEDGGDGAPAVAPESNAGAVTAIMATYWEDVDAAWETAVHAGAEVIYPLADQFYGERGGRLRDPFGQQWMMSQQIEMVSAEEVKRRASNQ
jgi:PhnB protein